MQFSPVALAFWRIYQKWTVEAAFKVKLVCFLAADIRTHTSIKKAYIVIVERTLISSSSREKTSSVFLDRAGRLLLATTTSEVAAASSAGRRPLL